MTYDANDEYRWAEAQDARKAKLNAASDHVNERYGKALVDLADEALPVRFKRLDPAAIAPTYAHADDAGADLYALEDTIIEPGETAKVRTGIALELPAGFEAQIRPRSGVTLKTKLRVQLGTVDSGYNGEIGVLVDNIAESGPHITRGIWTLGDELHGHDREINCHSYIIRKHERIAQLVIAPVSRAHFTEATGELGESERGAGGFGSSGVKSKEDE